MTFQSMSEGARILLIAAVSIAAGFTWQGLRAAAIPVASPDRLVAELRLAQVAAFLLATLAAAYLGLAATHETVPGAGLDIALAIGFGLLAGSTLVSDPRQALTILALAFAGHALLDIAHRPGALPEDLAPRWYSVGCAVLNVYLGAVTYWPIMRR